jgi:hypothetical protein
VEGISTVVIVAAFLYLGLGERDRDLREPVEEPRVEAAAGDKCLVRPLGAGERDRVRSLVDRTSRNEDRNVGLNGSSAEELGEMMFSAWAYFDGAAAVDVSLDSAEMAKLVVIDGGG